MLLMVGCLQMPGEPSSNAGRSIPAGFFLAEVSPIPGDSGTESSILEPLEVVDSLGQEHSAVVVAHEPWWAWDSGRVVPASRPDTLWYGEGDSLKGKWNFADVGGHLAIVGGSFDGEVMRLSAAASTMPDSAWLVRAALLSVKGPVTYERLKFGDVVVPQGGAIALRVDDAAGADSILIQYALVRGLPIEAAIPTARIGEPGYLTWRYLTFAHGLGLLTAAHSRHHGANPATTLDLAAEVMGSRLDLERHDLPAATFVVPGTWTDTFSVTKTADLLTQPGRMLRVFLEVEGQIGPAFRSLSDSSGTHPGQSHFSADGESIATLKSQTEAVISQGLALEFGWHTGRVQAEVIRQWFDYLQQERDAGMLTVLSPAALRSALRAGQPYRPLSLDFSAGQTGGEVSCLGHQAVVFDGTLPPGCVAEFLVSVRPLAVPWRLTLAVDSAVDLGPVIVTWPVDCQGRSVSTGRLLRLGHSGVWGRLMSLPVGCTVQRILVSVPQHSPSEITLRRLIVQPT